MRVLIVSHNPLSTYQSMGKTMLSLFSEFDTEELSQLYIYPSVPDVDKCKLYYRVTDKSVFKGIFTRKVKSARITPNLSHHTKFENEADENLYNNPKNAKSFRLLSRDIMWKLSPWWNSELKNWLDEVEPEVVFLAPGNCAFIYDMALKVSKVYEIPLVSYICDEYYFINRPKSILERIRSNKVRKKIRETMKQSEGIVTICKELEVEYSKEFNKKMITIMTGTNHNISTVVRTKDNIASITFMGNLSCNRDKSVCDVGQVLDEINFERGKKYILNIYTGITEPIKQELMGIKSIKLHSFISGSEFENVFWNSDMFLHVEDFNNDSIDRVKHSVSTKIADIMASGIPLFAYGPASVASMGHLIRNRSAIIVTEPCGLKDGLLEAFKNKELRKLVAENGISVANEFHNASDDSIRMHQFLEGCLL